MSKALLVSFLSSLGDTLLGKVTEKSVGMVREKIRSFLNNKKTKDFQRGIIDQYSNKEYYYDLQTYLSDTAISHFIKLVEIGDIVRIGENTDEVREYCGKVSDDFFKHYQYLQYRNEIIQLIYLVFNFLYCQYENNDPDLKVIFQLLKRVYSNIEEIRDVTRDTNTVVHAILEEKIKINSSDSETELEIIRLVGDLGFYIPRKDYEQQINKLINENSVIIIMGKGGVGKTISCRKTLLNLREINIIEISYDVSYSNKQIEYIIERTVFASEEGNGLVNHKKYILRNGVSDYIKYLINYGGLVVYIDNYSTPGYINNRVITSYNNYEGDAKMIISCRPENCPNALDAPTIEIDKISTETCVDLFVCYSGINKYINDYRVNEKDEINNLLSGLFANQEKFKNPFIIKLLAKCFISDLNTRELNLTTENLNSNLNSFLDSIKKISQKVGENNPKDEYTSLIISLINEFFSTNVFSYFDMCFLHFICVCYGKIKKSKGKEFLEKLKEVEYENIIDIEAIEKYFSSNVYIDLHDILAEAIRTYVENKTDTEFKNVFYEFYTKIVAVFLRFTNFGRIGVFDKSTSLILPFSKLLKYLDGVMEKETDDSFNPETSIMKELYRVTTEAYNNLAYLQISIQQDYSDVEEAVNNSNKALTNIRKKLDKFTPDCHKEYFKNCDCDNCRDNCNNLNMKWACHFKENIYCNVRGKCLANSYNPFKNHDDYESSVEEVSEEFLTSNDKYSKYKDAHPEKFITRYNEFLYTECLYYYKMACIYRKDEYKTTTLKILKKNITSICQMIKDSYDIDIGNDYSLKNINEIVQQCKIEYENADKDSNAGKEIKNLMFSYFLYLIYSVVFDRYQDCRCSDRMTQNSSMEMTQNSPRL